MSDLQLDVLHLQPNISVSLPNSFNTHWVYPHEPIGFQDTVLTSTSNVVVMLLSFNNLVNDTELLDHKHLYTIPTINAEYFEFVDSNGVGHSVFIRQESLQLTIALTVGNLSFYENMTTLTPLHVTRTVVFPMEHDFPRESRNTDFTAMFQYTSLQMSANVNMFNKAWFNLPDTLGNVSTVCVEYREQERTLNGFIQIGNVISNHIFPEIANVHFNCLCSATDDIHVTVSRTNYKDSFTINNIRLTQGLFLRSPQYDLVLYESQSSNNVFIGTQSGYNNNGGEFNVFVGNKSGENNTKGSRNAFFGYLAGRNNIRGMENVFLGTESGLNNRDGNNNIFMGYQSGYNNNSGNYNIFMGYRAGYNNTVGRDNVFLGRRAGFLNTTGNYNVFIGNECGYFNVTGSGCTIIGTNTKGELPNPNVDLYANFAPRSSIPEDDDDEELLPPVVNINNYISVFTINPSANVNTSIEGTTGSYNTVLGVGAGVPFYEGTGTGNRNTIIGSYAGELANASSDNTYIGYQAGRFLVSSHQNTFVGSYSGGGNVSNNLTQLTAIGYRSGYRSVDSTNNLLLGIRAGSHSSNISNNIYIGNYNGLLNSNSAHNIYIGHNTGNDVQGSNNVIIGHNIAQHTELNHVLNIANTIIGDTHTGDVHISGILS